MVNEANKSVHTNAVDEHEEMDFAAMLEESFKDSEKDALINGVVVAIKEDVILVDVGKKSEGRLNAAEVTDENGNITCKVGDVIPVVVTGFRNERPVVSHKKALRKDKIKSFIADFKEEDDVVVDVKITGKNKGGFIAENKEGIEFFLPRSQAAVKDLNTLVGKSLKVKVIKIDNETESIIISRKKFLDDERKKRKEIVQELIDRDEVVDGTIKKITTYGMFVDVGGIDGLVHYSEISYKGPVNPGTLYKEGEVIPVKAIKYDKDKRHLSLSVKAAMPDPWDEIKDELEIGDSIQVTISNIEPYGAFVDLGNDIEGFLHISEISWDKNIKHPRDYIEEGQVVDVEVIEIDAKERRLRVSLKNVLPKPFNEFMKKFKVGDVVKGEITTITNFGAFVKIGGIEGLLHNEDASWDRNNKCKELLNVGDVVEVKIVKIDEENEKVSLSKKELEDSPIQRYAKSHENGDIVHGKIRDIKDFGIFVELEENVDALIRKEDLGQVSEADLKVGDEIEAAITFIDDKKNRIRLSVRRLSKLKEREALKEINKEEKMTLGDILKDQLK
ncbi:30S ribosomal protein S1 [Sulfurospirillum sp. hDNRA2]|uniref:30S ribosomal protein S1 n=1 Tax=Sulfurospirillum sp. hDNRA2 TaxID=3237298 RepID=UPI0020B8988A|nr:30S ribosomal protein S1 [Sulfurospirillum sp. DNRA8]MCP3651861.1 30S ribosomal protein S1 [Sulfurospirillum sp. DNRA8]MCR1810708.1 30S ribosomal protein S1 [Sulfurospirillum sp. DNRA8]